MCGHTKREGMKSKGQVFQVKAGLYSTEVGKGLCR